MTFSVLNHQDQYSNMTHSDDSNLPVPHWLSVNLQNPVSHAVVFFYKHAELFLLFRTLYHSIDPHFVNILAGRILVRTGQRAHMRSWCSLFTAGSWTRSLDRQNRLTTDLQWRVILWLFLTLLQQRHVTQPPQPARTRQSRLHSWARFQKVKADLTCKRSRCI